jgi:hypothetical protein
VKNSKYQLTSIPNGAFTPNKENTTHTRAKAATADPMPSRIVALEMLRCLRG